MTQRDTFSAKTLRSRLPHAAQGFPLDYGWLASARGGAITSRGRAVALHAAAGDCGPFSKLALSHAREGDPAPHSIPDQAFVSRKIP